MTNVINIFKFRKAKITLPRNPTIHDIIDMYELGAITATEAIEHLNEFDYLNELLMKAIIKSCK